MKTLLIKKIVVWFGYWVASWLDVVCGTISVITFCAWRPWWDITFRANWTIRNLSKFEKEEME